MSTRTCATISGRCNAEISDTNVDILAKKIVEKLISSDTFMDKLKTIIHECTWEQSSDLVKEQDIKISQLEHKLMEST